MKTIYETKFDHSYIDHYFNLILTHNNWAEASPTMQIISNDGTKTKWLCITKEQILALQKIMKAETHYYLLGQYATSLYNDGDMNLLSNDGGYGLYKFVHGETNPTEFAAAFDGWLAYTEITEEEYQTLSEL